MYTHSVCLWVCMTWHTCHRSHLGPAPLPAQPAWSLEYELIHSPFQYHCSGSFFCCWDRTPWSKAPWVGLFQFRVIMKEDRTQAPQEPKDRNECGDHDGVLTGLLACSTWLAHPAFSHIPRPSAQCDIIHNELDPPPSTIKKTPPSS